MERYRSGHNEAVLKTVCPQGRVGSNPTLSVRLLRKPRTLKTKQQCNPEKFQEKISEKFRKKRTKTVKKERLKLAKVDFDRD